MSANANRITNVFKKKTGERNVLRIDVDNTASGPAGLRRLHVHRVERARPDDVCEPADRLFAPRPAVQLAVN